MLYVIFNLCVSVAHHSGAGLTRCPRLLLAGWQMSCHSWPPMPIITSGVLPADSDVQAQRTHFCYLHFLLDSVTNNNRDRLPLACLLQLEPKPKGDLCLCVLRCLVTAAPAHSETSMVASRWTTATGDWYTKLTLAWNNSFIRFICSWPRS